MTDDPNANMRTTHAAIDKVADTAVAAALKGHDHAADRYAEVMAENHRLKDEVASLSEELLFTQNEKMGFQDAFEGAEDRINQVVKWINSDPSAPGHLKGISAFLKGEPLDVAGFIVGT